jgi:mannose-6-phosphate isomerase-like protein (cupin superfamily)
MEGHTHSIAEIYIIINGQGVAVVVDEEREVTCGDVIEIPPDAYYTLRNDKEDEFLWAAFWWIVSRQGPVEKVEE